MMRMDFLHRWSARVQPFYITAGPTDVVGTDSVVVTWALSEGATGKVEYGLTSAYGSSTTEEASFNYATHVQTVTGLTPATLYHYRVSSTNSTGSTVVSEDRVITTDSTAPVGTYYYPPAPIGGGSDDTAALNTWLATVPSGSEASPSIILFDPTATYTLTAADCRLHLRDRAWVYVYGMDPGLATGAASEAMNRCRINASSSTFGLNASVWAIGNNYGPCHDIKIVGFDIQGTNTANFQTVDQYSPGKETACGFQLYAAAGQYNVEIAYNVVEHVWGHGIYLRVTDGTTQWLNVNLHHNIIRGAGVMGIAVSNGNFIYIDDNLIYDSGLYPIDFEDGYSPSTLSDVYVRRNTLTDWVWTDTYPGPLAIVSWGGPLVHTRFTITDNVFAGTYRRLYDPNWDYVRGLIDFQCAAGSSAFTIDGNTSTVAKDGNQARLSNIAGVTFTDNAFTGSASGANGVNHTDVVLATTSCTSVVNTGNTIA